MPRTLYAKLSLALALLLMVIGLMYALLSVSATRHYLEEVNQRFNRDLARNLVADRDLVQQGAINESALKETFHYFMTINPSIEIYLLNPEGEILSYSAEPDKVKRKRVSLAPIKAFLQGTQSFPLLGDDPRSHQRHKVFSVTPVPSAEDLQGYLYVILRGEEFDLIDQAIQEGYFLRMSGWSVFGSLIFGLFLGLLVFHLLTRRLQRLAKVMDNFRNSDFSDKVALSKNHGSWSGDEIAGFETTFAEMANHIIAQLDELNTKDALRRQLVAQVSHDLRTPLASLHGYLETLQIKESMLSVDERAEYLAIALRQSERLTRLVEDLFELAKLETKEKIPHLESFPVAELLQDVVLKFQLKAKKKGIRLVMQVPESVPFVVAEIGLIERVLENLLENALDHTPRGGLVRVDIRQSDKVTVLVEDTGCGITASDLPQVFEPFYQVGKTHRGSHHAGLGLAIAKRILELHNSKIEVSSQVDRGTTFSFALPLA
ncbi:MAG: HAMP domain-containing sensor histidine kinase [Pseudomonadota bacterium]